MKQHPAFYGYYLTDEPKAGAFPAPGKLVAHVRERDPAHLGFINLNPTYASNTHLGTKGNTVEAYAEHLRQYVKIVQPALLSHDHYQFTNSGDYPEYQGTGGWLWAARFSLQRLLGWDGWRR